MKLTLLLTFITLATASNPITSYQERRKSEASRVEKYFIKAEEGFKAMNSQIEMAEKKLATSDATVAVEDDDILVGHSTTYVLFC